MSEQQLPEFTYEQIVEGTRPPVLSGPYIPAYLVRAEIARLTVERDRMRDALVDIRDEPLVTLTIARSRATYALKDKP